MKSGTVPETGDRRTKLKKGDYFTRPVPLKTTTRQKPVGRKSTNPASSLKVANRKELGRTRETIVNVKKKRELGVNQETERREVRTANRVTGQRSLLVIFISEKHRQLPFNSQC